MTTVVTRSLLLLALAGSASGVAFGAPQGGAAPARPAAGAPQTARPAGPIPTGRVACIDFGVFPQRVTQMKRVYDSLNAQFATQGKELQSLQDRLGALQAQTQQGTASPQQQEQMAQQFEQLKKEFDRKKEDLDVAARRAYQQAMTPVQEKMNTAINEFARARGIVVVVNLAQARQTGSLLYFSPATDVTEAFIEEYNKKNP
jgi:Skp family chaperone for outer membrane proteins